MRQTLALTCLLAVAGLAPLATAAVPEDPPGIASSWAAAEIRALVARGVLAASAETFRPDDPLTRGELHDALTGLGLRAAAPSERDRLVVLNELDATLVDALGLGAAARSIRAAAHSAGLKPTSYVGTESVARLLGLRVNHPQGEEYLELGPAEPATRAEAAYTLARALAVTAAQKADLVRLSGTLRLPQLTAAQRAVLTRALRLVGHPYVWAGASERTQQLAGGLAPGGFDCSGLVWRVFKAQPYPEAPLLGETIRGRTTFSMSAERLRSERLAQTVLRPGDLVFFGARGPASTPQEVGHMGIVVAPGWFVHSSVNGVTLQPLRGWYAARFAWGRSPIREAGVL